MNKKTLALLQILLACFFWGYGFIAVRDLLQVITPLGIVFIRFGIATLFMFLLIGTIHKHNFFYFNSLFFKSKEWRLGIWPGIFLGGALLLQTFGLNYTSAAKSAFITTLYVIFVPFTEHYFSWKKKNHIPFKIILVDGISIILSLIGIAMLSHFSFNEWTIGDTLTLICALASTGHIITVDYAAKKNVNSLSLHFSQCLVTFILTCLCLPFAPKIFINDLISPSKWAALFILIFGTSFLAFYLQLKSQKYLSMTTSSFLFLLESPIAMSLAYLILNERVSSIQFAGGMILLIACTITIFRPQLPLLLRETK